MCFAVPLMPSFSRGTSFVSIAYVSALVSVKLVRFRLKRPYSPASASFRLHSLSVRLHRLMYRSEDRRTPDLTVSKVSCRFCGRLSSSPGGSVLPTNSSWTLIVACLRQTASSWKLR